MGCSVSLGLIRLGDSGIPTSQSSMSGSTAPADSVQATTKTSSRKTGARGISHRRLPKRAIDEIVARRNDTLLTECGCITLPEVLHELLGGALAKCTTHGWQKIERKATGREALNFFLGYP